MFKSKKFTVLFSIMSVLIIALAALLIYLVFGKSGVSLNNSSTTAVTTAEETTTEAESTTAEAAEGVLRPLTSGEEHFYPIINEEIPEKGTLSIIKSGDAGEGIVFHKEPAFDGEDAEGNKNVTSGTFSVVAKIYILENDRAYLMYKTSDGFYVTSNKTYVEYTPSSDYTAEPDLSNVTSFGYDETLGVCVDIYSDDGFNIAFSIFDYDYANAATTPVLSNVIAEYNSDGTASFEYMNKDGKVYTGTLRFINVAEAYFSKQVEFNFTSRIEFSTGTQTGVILHN